MSLEETVKSLTSLGVAFKALQTGTDGAALVLPEYGRVLGLWPYWRGENAFWVNPRFFQTLQIGAKQTEWVNPGGDRMYLCPESEFFIPDEAHPAETYAIPQALDPGSFAASFDKESFELENHGDLWAHRSQTRIGFRLARRIRMFSAKELEVMWGTTYLRQAGYEEETALELKDCPFPVGVWAAICLDTGGRAVLPLQKYWAEYGLSGFPTRLLELSGGCAVIRVGGTDTIALWLDALESKTRAAYIRENGETGRASMVLKEFQKAEPADYVKETVQRGVLGGVVGFSCPGSHSPYCELGVRSPAAAGSGGKRKLSWKSSLWAFSGRIEEIGELARKLLG
jgi:hypothetical protein